MRILDWMKGATIIGFLGLLLGCATSEDIKILDQDVYQLGQEVRQIKPQMDKLGSDLKLIQSEKEILQNKLSILEKETKRDISALQNQDILLKGDITKETQKLQADLSFQFQTLQSEIQKFSTSIEEYKDFLMKVSRDIDRLGKDFSLRTEILDARVKSLEIKNKAQEEQVKIFEEKLKGMEIHIKGIENSIKGTEDNIKGLHEKMGQVLSKQNELEKSISEKESSIGIKGLLTGAGDWYKEAYETFQRGDLEGARRKFEAFLKQYPNTDLSDNAQFWIGEIYYLKKDFEKAILEYEKAIVKYPEGDKIPAALFKQALAFLELGDKTNAKSLLKRIIERYPNSEQASLAQKKLEGIK